MTKNKIKTIHVKKYTISGVASRYVSFLCGECGTAGMRTKAQFEKHSPNMVKCKCCETMNTFPDFQTSEEVE